MRIQRTNLSNLSRLLQNTHLDSKVTSSSVSSSSSVYILRLKCEKYYVGKTNKSVNERFLEHLNGDGSKWTEKYEPIEVLKTYENCNNYDEDKYTIEMMGKYGIENVRGGSFVSFELSKEEIEVISKMIKSGNNSCFLCGKQGHFIRDCPQKKLNSIRNHHVSQRVQTDHGFQEGSSILRCPQKRLNPIKNHHVSQRVQTDHGFQEDDVICYRCGRIGHIRPECYASTHINGYYL